MCDRCWSIGMEAADLEAYGCIPGYWGSTPPVDKKPAPRAQEKLPRQDEVTTAEPSNAKRQRIDDEIARLEKETKRLKLLKMIEVERNAIADLMQKKENKKSSLVPQCRSLVKTF